MISAEVHNLLVMVGLLTIMLWVIRLILKIKENQVLQMALRDPQVRSADQLYLRLCR